MEYEDIGPLSRAAAEDALASPDTELVTRALTALALHDPEWRYVQSKCVALLKDTRWQVCAVAATCLGHLARIHRILDLPLVETALNEAAERCPHVAGYVEQAFEDIDVYCGDPSREECRADPGPRRGP